MAQGSATGRGSVDVSSGAGLSIVVVTLAQVYVITREFSPTLIISSLLLKGAPSDELPSKRKLVFLLKGSLQLPYNTISTLLNCLWLFSSEALLPPPLSFFFSSSNEKKDFFYFFSIPIFWFVIGASSPLLRNIAPPLASIGHILFPIAETPHPILLICSGFALLIVNFPAIKISCLVPHFLYFGPHNNSMSGLPAPS